MYLEISARGTGKTSRMLLKIKYDIIDGIHPVIFVQNHHMIHSLMKSLQQYPDQYSIFISLDDFKRWRSGNWNKKISFFVDEFDLMDGDFVISTSGYYCGTLTRTRTINDIINHAEDIKFDPFIELLRLNEGKHISYSAIPLILKQGIDSLLIKNDLLSVKSIKTEILNTIFN